jgi:2-keto-4-pentenoate hydratase/2-oxohepta-3-ene-1,7-dioic acid hydratase in catechol pathway
MQSTVWSPVVKVFHIVFADAGNLVKEAGRSPPPFPFIFFKPTTCIADHNADVVIPKICQDDQADYEGELVSEVCTASGVQ